MGIEGDLADPDDRAPLHLDGADEERRAERGRRHAGRCQRPQAPVAILRVEHGHLLPAHGPDHPDLQEVQALFHAVADAHGGGGGAPEFLEGETHDPEVDLLVERGALGRLGLPGGRVAGRGATGPVRLEAVALQGADVGGMRRLDAEGAHVRRGEVERDVILLRAQHRLAGVRHVHGDRLGDAEAAEMKKVARSASHL